MKLLKEGARQLGLPLSDAQIELFELYCDALLARNKEVNLTAITDREGVQTTHFLDSLSCVAVCPEDVLEQENGHTTIVDAQACISCWICVDNCVSGAIEVD